MDDLKHERTADEERGLVLGRAVDWAFTEARYSDPINQRHFFAGRRMTPEEVKDMFTSVQQLGISGEEIVEVIRTEAVERFLSDRLRTIRESLAIQAVNSALQPLEPPVV